MRTIVRLVLALACFAGAPVASAQLAPDPAVDGGAPRAWRDGERVLVAHPRGDGRVTVTTEGRSFVARASAEAIVAGALSSLDALAVDVVRVLSERRGVALVRSRRDEDGIALASRLGPHVGRELRYAVPDLHLRRRVAAIDVPPDDPRYGAQWYLGRIDIERAWRIETGDPSVTITIVDNGCDLAHPDLAPQLLPGRDVLDGDDDPSHVPLAQGNEHGTACAGIAGARGDDGIGIAGACPECSLRCVRLLAPDESEIPLSADVEAFQLAIDRGDSVVSNSWGFVERIPVPAPLAEVVEAAFTEGRGGRGALVVFAAGNDDRELGDEELTAVRGVITVGALRSRDEATSFTNRGASVDLSAPTGTVTTDVTGADGNDESDYTALFGGTSAAAPVVSGVAALLFAAAPEASAQEVHDALIATARRAPYATPDENGHDPIYGFGVVDPGAALERLLAAHPRPDAGIGADAGAGADAPPGCSCSAAGRGPRAMPLGLLVIALAWLAQRVRLFHGSKRSMSSIFGNVPSKRQPRSSM
ncbi:S8 family serine peptidase [Sandaracinus amylolyticus]|uniref:Alkaline serine protease, subtilase family n=1 Tax=Sandaracinus amylolyticus TaxID=927083 RepID=A0A0F6YH14_9BACT|nr:S8 family serine peptidase [Sandaracinus amylolyticus]AKF05335.1 Alkaline serine protease, subtilase family [Sandaracinus amylolyticus]